jgi:excisionase family DNA binding protein
MPDDECGTVTVPEAGKALGLTRHGAYAAAKRGEIPTLRFGRLLRVSRRWLDQVLCNGPIPLDRMKGESNGTSEKGRTDD